MDKIIVRECKKHGNTDYVLESSGYYRCKRCRVDGVNNQRRRNKAKIIEHHGGKCILCGYDKFQGALHFHHRIPEDKSFGISARGLSKSYTKLLVESLKCDLLCANCHAEKHNKDIC